MAASENGISNHDSTVGISDNKSNATLSAGCIGDGALLDSLGLIDINKEKRSKVSETRTQKILKERIEKLQKKQ